MGGTTIFKQRFQNNQQQVDEKAEERSFWRPWVEEENVPGIFLSPCENIQCQYENCNVTCTARKKEKKTYEDAVHEKHFENKCKFCSKRFTRKDNLTRHVNMKHKLGILNLPHCPFCYKKLSRQDAVQRHMIKCQKHPQKVLNLVCSKKYDREN